LKPSNLLVTKDGILKIADFGNAKIFGSPDKNYTPGCVTIHYRSPEMLFGANQYGPSSDMWSIGCILGELLLRTPLFPGDGREIDQISKIFSCMGTPNEKVWPEMKSLKDYIPFEEFQSTPFKDVFKSNGDEVDLASKFLVFDPFSRISCEKALNHNFFKNSPKPTLNHLLPFHKSEEDQNKENKKRKMIEISTPERNEKNSIKKKLF
jgi:cyclin-dependent kinase 7